MRKQVRLSFILLVPFVGIPGKSQTALLMLEIKKLVELSCVSLNLIHYVGLQEHLPVSLHLVLAYSASPDVSSCS